jgi:hypothetical protein
MCTLLPGQAALLAPTLPPGQDTPAGFAAAVPGAVAHYTQWRAASGTWCGYAVFDSVAGMGAAVESCALKMEEFTRKEFPYHHVHRG